MKTVSPSAKRIALQTGEGDARWFLGGLSIIKASGESTEGRVAVTENWAPRGYGPRDVPHTFIVSSDEARFLLVVEPAGFENFLLGLSGPAESLTLPPSSVEPPPLEAMMAAAATYGLEILGPPGIPS